MKKWILLYVAIACPVLLQADPVRNALDHSESKDAHPGANYLVLFDSTKVDVQESGLSYVTMHRLYKVFNASGARDLSVITIGYDPLSAYVEIREVTIYRKDGSIEKLDTANVLDYPAPARAIYWGAREKMIEVGRLEPGDAVDVHLFRKGFTYALLEAGQKDDERYIPPMRGHFYDIVEFWNREPMQEKVYQTSIPKDKTVQFEFYNGEARCSAVLRDGKMIYTFAKKDIRPVKREPWMVAPSDVAPKLLISTSPDWNAKSAWFYNVNEDYGSFDVTPEIQDKVDEILTEAKSEMDSISLLTHWVADEIRYSGVSMGEGEGYTLHKGEMTFLDRCGVCKDKAGMLVTMLRAAGFESYAAMTMAGSRIDYIPADQFNHSVTVVKQKNGTYLLLDPTWVPFLRELWSSAEQQQNYLLGVPETADLMITPVSPPENHYLYMNGNSEILENGTLQGNITITAEGQSDAALRRMFTGSPVSRWEKNIEAEIKKEHPRAVLTHISYDDPYDYMSGPIRLDITYEIPEYAVVTEEEIIFTPFAATEIFMRGMSHMHQNTNLEEREHAFRDRCSRLVRLHEQVRLPCKTTAVFLPEAEAFQSEAASFKGGYDLDPEANRLTLSEEITLNKRIYPSHEWPGYRKAVESQKTFAENPVILKIEK
ncbi:MAG: DUF3857 and transglutaminase domain-containing protein [Bacteroidales bacterium]